MIVSVFKFQQIFQTKYYLSLPGLNLFYRLSHRLIVSRKFCRPQLQPKFRVHFRFWRLKMSHVTLRESPRKSSQMLYSARLRRVLRFGLESNFSSPFQDFRPLDQKVKPRGNQSQPSRIIKSHKLVQRLLLFLKLQKLIVWSKSFKKIQLGVHFRY